MNAIERLQRDHAILRAKLDVLETALGMGPETWFVLREACFSLSRQLRAHLRREERLIAACRAGLSKTLLARLGLEHKDEPTLLRTLNRLFLREEGHALDTVRPMLTQVIAGLRAHMVDEEQTLFPRLTTALAMPGVRAPQEDNRGTEHFTDTMAVNRVLHDFPSTRRVFDSLFVNVPYEGCDCLDEVAWRHGMRADALLRKLEAALPSATREASR